MKIPDRPKKGMTRREFVKKGIQGGIIVTATPVIMSSLLSGCAPSPVAPKVPWQLTPEILQKLLDVALSKGGDFADIYVEHRVSTQISLEENLIKSLDYGINQGVGIRVIAGEEVGYSYTDDLAMKKLEETARTAAYIAATGIKPSIANLSERSVKKNIIVEIGMEKVIEKKKVLLMQAANEAARAFDPAVKEVTVRYSDEIKNLIIANSEGRLVHDEQPLFRLGVSALAVRNGVRQMGSESLSERSGYEVFKRVSPADLGKEAARQAVSMLDAREAPTGEMPVIIANGWGGVLIHEAIGHGFEGDFIRKKTSFYTDKVGEKVASENVSIVDDGSLRNRRGTLNADDEGTITRRNILIENGICQGFLYDIFNAGLMKTYSTGNARRQSFRYIPIPRMTNTFMLAGEDAAEDMVRRTRSGLRVRKLGGGQVDITSGNFVFQVTEAYMIERGRTTYPVKGATLIGNGPEVLTKVDMVGPDLDYGPGSCGKDGQSVPCCVGQPTVRISAITVGGTRV